MNAKLFLGTLVINLFLVLEFCKAGNDKINSDDVEKSNEDYFIGSSFRVFPDTLLQVETKIATHPQNPQIMACSAVTDFYPGGYTTGVYSTTNGGLSWSGSHAIHTSLWQYIVTLGNPCITIDKNGVFILTYISPSPNNGSNCKVGVSFSTNNGVYWSPSANLPGVDTADKCNIATDDVPTSPYYGRSYIVYSERRGIYFSYTTNSGANWSTVKRISPVYYDSRVGVSIAVGSGGEIYVTWPFLPQSNDFIGFARSTNGGATWDSSDTAIPVNPTPFDFRVNLNMVKLNGIPVIAADKSGGTRNGWIYIAGSEMKASGNPANDNCDIVMHVSTNKGISWPISYRVNQSDSTKLSYQIFPAMIVDKYGGINVSYYDTRNIITNDSFQIYLSHSDNGGLNFRDDMISGHTFKLKQLPADKRLFGIPYYIGTAAGITSSDNKVWSFWFDNYLDEYQGWLAPVEINSILNVKVIPQGLYNLSEGRLNCKDTLKVYIHNSDSPFQIIDSANALIDSLTFTAKLIFQKISHGNYYIDVFHKNSFHTWSNNPVSFNSSVINYDFTSSSSQAYGNNEVLSGNKWCIYSGDINCDEFIDAEDLMLIQNDALIMATGYSQTDVNGDMFVDVTDMLISMGNALNFAAQITP